jgi:hypothetical protein
MPRGYRLRIIAICGVALLIALGAGAFFGSLYTADHKRYQPVAGGNGGQGDYAGPSQSLPDIAGLPGPVERAIANPRPPGGQDHEKRDLAAQEASALWAFWMVVASFASVLITAVGTIFLYKQIVLTREAVQDTGDATEAMIEANKIAAQVQRPWISIEVELLHFEQRDRPIVMFSYVIRFKNTGQMVAEMFLPQIELTPMGSNFGERTMHSFNQFEASKNLMGGVLIPGGTHELIANSGYRIDKMPWYLNARHSRECRLIVLAMSHYKIPGDPTWRFAMQSFFIGQKIYLTDNTAFPHDIPESLTADGLIVIRSGMGRAT